MALFVRAARTAFTYKPALLLSMLTVAIGYAVPLLVWRHIYGVRREPLAVPASQLFPYLLLAASLHFVFLWGSSPAWASGSAWGSSRPIC